MTFLLSCLGLLFYCEEQLLLLLEAGGSNCSSEAISEYEQLSDARVKELSILPMFQYSKLSENQVREVRISKLITNRIEIEYQTYFSRQKINIINELWRIWWETPSTL